MPCIDEIRDRKYSFSAVKFDKKSLNNIQRLQSQFVKNPTDIKRIHCTVVFSRDKEMPFYPCKDHMDITATITGYDVWQMENEKYCLVALLDCEGLQERHKEMSLQYDVKDRYDDYKPHITLSYDVPKNMNTAVLDGQLDSVRIISEYCVTLNK